MVKVVTDSTADIPAEIRSREQITMVPLHTFFGEESYVDWVELLPEQFYEKLAASPLLPRTSQPTPVEFAATYRKIAGPNDPIISIHISAGLSGTLQSAHMARQELPDHDITVIDSTHTSMALGIQVIEAARAAKAGQSKEQVLEVAKHYRENMKLYFAVDTLEYLQKNGRIGKARALLGGLLNVKPLLSMAGGEIVPLEQVRGRAKVLERMLQLMEKDLGRSHPLKVAVVHAAIEKEGQRLLERIQSHFNVQEGMVASIGSVIGTHTGPGLLGIMVAPAFVKN